MASRRGQGSGEDRGRGCRAEKCSVGRLEVDDGWRHGDDGASRVVPGDEIVSLYGPIEFGSFCADDE